jgi:hypothetical protein
MNKIKIGVYSFLITAMIFINGALIFSPPCDCSEICPIIVEPMDELPPQKLLNS